MLGAQRVSPLFIRPQSLALYLPYMDRDSAEIDIICNRAFTVSGATASADEPPLLWLPGKRRIFLPAPTAPYEGLSVAHIVAMHTRVRRLFRLK